MVKPAPFWTSISGTERYFSASTKRDEGATQLIHTSILAYVIARLLLMLNIADWKGALRLGLWLLIGFPFILLTGSVFWQNVSWQPPQFMRETGS